MRSRKQTPPELNGDHVDDTSTEKNVAAVEALALAEDAEAEAAEADAAAAAARARAKALRLRREAAKAAETVAAPEPDTSDDTAEDASKVIEEADSADELEEEPARKRRRLRIPLPGWKPVAAAVVVIAIAALLTATGYMYWNHRQQAADQQRRAEYSAAARQSVVTLMSLDFNKAKDNVQRIIDNSTGGFKDDFKKQAEDFIAVAQESKVITEVTVNATAIESMTDDSAVVLVSATSRVTNSAGAKQEPRSWRLSVDLKHDGGQIKMSKVEFVP